MGRVLRPIVELEYGAFDLKSFKIVGGYGLQFSWGDGHGTGIYSIAYLEKLHGLKGSD